MKYFVLFSVAVLVVGCGGNQPDTDPAISLPVETAMETASSGLGVPNLTGGINMANQEVCRTNMLTASASITMYIAQHGTPPETLDEAGVHANCPEASAFRYTVDGQNWSLECQADLSHGSVRNGVISW
jgi:hypothetical protein